MNRIFLRRRVLEASRTSDSSLKVAGVSKAFGGVRALDGVDLTASRGRVTAIIGANGSGKTTLLNVVSGFVVPDAGDVRLGDEYISRLRAHERSRGSMLVRTFQTPAVPKGLTVLEAAAAGVYTNGSYGLMNCAARLPAYRKAWRTDRSKVMAALEGVGLAEQINNQAVSLSLGGRRFLELARCISAEPAVVLLDEPASGLSLGEVERLRDVVRTMADAGAAVIVVEHNFKFVASVADVIYVMDIGRVVMSGGADAVRDDERVIASYFGVPNTDGKAPDLDVRSEDVEA